MAYEDDLKAVRRSCYDHHGFIGGSLVQVPDDEALLALSRMDAKHQQLRGELLEIHDKLAHAENEVERLRQDKARLTIERDLHHEDRKKAEQENERLRALQEKTNADADAFLDTIAELTDENGRIRQMSRGSGIWSEIDRLTRENKRLYEDVEEQRGNAHGFFDEWKRAEAEVERLRKDKNSLMGSSAKWQRIAEANPSGQAYLKACADTDRLREENERLREEREQLQTKMSDLKEAVLYHVKRKQELKTEITELKDRLRGREPWWRAKRHDNEG